LALDVSIEFSAAVVIDSFSVEVVSVDATVIPIQTPPEKMFSFWDVLGTVYVFLKRCLGMSRDLKDVGKKNTR